MDPNTYQKRLAAFEVWKAQQVDKMKSIGSGSTGSDLATKVKERGITLADYRDFIGEWESYESAAAKNNPVPAPAYDPDSTKRFLSTRGRPGEMKEKAAMTQHSPYAYLRSLQGKGFGADGSVEGVEPAPAPAPAPAPLPTPEPESPADFSFNTSIGLAPKGPAFDSARNPAMGQSVVGGPKLPNTPSITAPVAPRGVKYATPSIESIQGMWSRGVTPIIGDRNAPSSTPVTGAEFRAQKAQDYAATLQRQEAEISGMAARVRPAQMERIKQDEARGAAQVEQYKADRAAARAARQETRGQKEARLQREQELAIEEKKAQSKRDEFQKDRDVAGINASALNKGKSDERVSKMNDSIFDRASAYQVSAPPEDRAAAKAIADAAKGDENIQNALIGNFFDSYVRGMKGNDDKWESPVSKEQLNSLLNHPTAGPGIRAAILDQQLKSIESGALFDIPGYINAMSLALSGVIGE